MDIGNAVSFFIGNPEEEAPVTEAVADLDENFVESPPEGDVDAVVVEDGRPALVELPDFPVVEPDLASVVRADAELNLFFFGGVDEDQAVPHGPVVPVVDVTQVDEAVVNAVVGALPGEVPGFFPDRFVESDPFLRRESPAESVVVVEGADDHPLGFEGHAELGEMVVRPFLSSCVDIHVCQETSKHHFAGLCVVVQGAFDERFVEFLSGLGILIEHFV